MNTFRNQFPLLSIIVPVYNVEEYLPRCIDSILSQTFTDFELILIDDGSPDDSGEVCDIWAEKDSRIRVIHKSNGGVNAARNTGLSLAKGRYITFIDGDDFIKSNTFEKALAILEENSEIDLLQYPEIQVQDGKERLWSGYPKVPIILSNSCEKMKAIIGAVPYIPGGLWGKIYRGSVWNNLRLRADMCFCEDMIILPDILEKGRSIMITTDGGYCYVMRSGSATKSAYTPKKCLDVCRLKIRLFEAAIKYNIDTDRWWNNAILSAVDAWGFYGPCEELRAALKYLQKIKRNIPHTLHSSKRVVRLAYILSPLFAAKINRAMLKLKKKI